MATTTRYDISRVNGPDPTPAKDPRVVGHRPTTVGGGKVTSPRTGRAKQQHAVTKRAPKSHITVAKKAPPKQLPVTRAARPKPKAVPHDVIGNYKGNYPKVAPKMKPKPIARRIANGNTYKPGTGMNGIGGPYVNPPTGATAPKMKETLLGRPVKAKAKR